MDKHYRTNKGLMAPIILVVLFFLSASTVNAQNPPPAPIYSGSQEVCLNDVSTYTVTNTESGANYTWQVSNKGTILNSGYDGDGNAYASINWHTLAQGSQGWVRATATNDYGTTIGDKYFVEVEEVPGIFVFEYTNFNFPGDDAENAYYCHESAGVDISMSNSQVNTDYELRRLADDVVVDTEAGTGSSLMFTGVTVENHNNSQASATAYYVIAVNENSCSEQMEGVVTVHKFEQVDGGTVTTNSPSTIGVCENGPVITNTVTPSGGDGTGFTYQWQTQFDGGGWNDIAGATSLGYDASGSTLPTGVHEFRRMATNTCADVYSNVITIEVDEAPTANAGVDFEAGLCETPQINGGGTGTGIDYSWSPATYLNDPNLAQPTFDAGAAGVGEYTYTLTVTDTYGCTNSDEVTITVVPDETVDAGNDADVCGFVYTLDATASSTGEWSYTGPGSVTNWSPDQFDPNAEVTVDTYGVYTFTYTVPNGNCPPVSDDVEIQFKETPAPQSLVGNPVEACQGSTVTYELANPIGGNSVLWTVDNGAIISGQGTAVVEIEWDIDMVNYEIMTGTLSVNEDNGTCSTDTDFNFDLFPMVDPSTTVTGNDTANAYSTGHVYSVDPVTAGYSYLWTVTGGTIDGANNQEEVVVDWGAGPAGTVEVTVSNTCDTKDFDQDVLLMPNLLHGQLKYYNDTESPVPSPYPANVSGNTVPDYFWVSLVNSNFDVANDNPYTDADVIETDKVEIYWDEEMTEYKSYFEFSHNLNPSEQYRVVVWDGGFLEESNIDPLLGYTWNWNSWGGVNATDALAIQFMAANIDISAPPYNMTWIGDPGMTPPYGFFANGLGDVNASSSLTGLDALMTSQRAVGNMATFFNNKPNFEVAGIMVAETDFNAASVFGVELTDIEFDKRNGSYLYTTNALEHNYYSDLTNFEAIGNQYLNIYYSAVGDINASYDPEYGGFKSESDIQLDVDSYKGVNAGEVIEIPVTLGQAAQLGAISMDIEYNNELIEVIEVNYGDDFARIDQENGKVNIDWFDTRGAYINAGEPVVVLKARVLGNVKNNTEIISLAGAELANTTAEVLDNVQYKTIGLNNEIGAELSADNYPNPFTHQTTISYNLPENGKVLIEVYNMVGKKVTTLLNETQNSGLHEFEMTNENMKPGVYHYRLILEGANTNYSVTKRMVISK